MGRRGKEREGVREKEEEKRKMSYVRTSRALPTYPPSPPQYRCLMGFSPVGYVQDPMKTPMPHIPLMRAGQAIWLVVCYCVCVPFHHCPSGQPHGFSSIPAATPANFLTRHIGVIFLAPMRPTEPLSYQMMKVYLVHSDRPYWMSVCEQLSEARPSQTSTSEVIE